MTVTLLQDCVVEIYFDETLTNYGRYPAGAEVAILDQNGYRTSVIPLTRWEDRQRARDGDSKAIAKLDSIYWDGVDPDALYGKPY